jgi:Bifunctional DNA primase/polymerase, N-terminal/AAA domain/Primase C terminal 1 (PriCT-1)
MTQAATEPINELLDAALEYQAQGRPIFPVCWTEPHQHRVVGHAVDCDEKNRGKTPLVPWKEFQSRPPTEREVRRWWRKWPMANIGMATGECSGIVVGDLDGELAQAKANDYGYAAGPHVLTGRPGGLHLFFAWRTNAPHNFAKKQGIDFRGDGGYVVLPPSRHVRGTTYRWGQRITSIAELPPLPEWFDLLAGNVEHHYARAEVVDDVIPDHERNTTLLSLGGSMRRRGMSETEILAALGVVNAERCRPPLSDDEVAKIAHSVARYAPEEAPTTTTRQQQRRQQQTKVDLSKVKITYVSEIQPEPITWVWDKRLPLGKFVLLQGDPGLGKSLVTTELAACVSTGRAMPGEPVGTVHEPHHVLLMVNEDDLASTIRPRLETAGADLTRISIIEGQYDDEGVLMPLNIADLQQLRYALETKHAVMLIIDPLFGHLPAGVSITREEEIRHLLAPLIALVAELDVALVGIRHLNQSIDLPSQYRGLGAGVWTAQARSELSCMVDPTNDAAGRKRYVIGRSKGNLGIEPPVLTYTITAESDDGPPRIVWGDIPSPMTWDELIREAASARRSDSAVSKAQTAVLRAISDAGEAGITWAEVTESVVHQGHSEHSARRARADLAPDIVSRKSKTDDGQMQTRWYLLEHFKPAQDEQLAQESASRAREGGKTGQVGQVDQEETPLKPEDSTPIEDSLPNLSKNTPLARARVKASKPESPAWDDTGETW